MNYNSSVVHKAKSQCKDQAIATRTVAKTILSASNTIRKVKEIATAKVMKAEASSSYLMDQMKQSKERYIESKESRQQAYNRETARLKQKHQKELQSLQAKMSQLKTTMSRVKKQHTKEKTQLYKQAGKISTELATLECIN